jgi:hypothetical protein
MRDGDGSRQGEMKVLSQQIWRVDLLYRRDTMKYRREVQRGRGTCPMVKDALSSSPKTFRLPTEPWSCSPVSETQSPLFTWTCSLEHVANGSILEGRLTALNHGEIALRIYELAVFIYWARTAERRSYIFLLRTLGE